uniref:Saposin B-type domain-containing protein n=1 Tax=Plectus sambesii TaxID=2011161 RepID=A0A914WMS3_9BILA
MFVSLVSRQLRNCADRRGTAMYSTTVCFLLLSALFLESMAVPVEKAYARKDLIECTSCHMFILVVQNERNMSLNDCEAEAINECRQIMGPFSGACQAFIRANGPHLYQVTHNGGANGACNQWC